MRLIPKAGAVLFHSSSARAAFVTFLIDGGIKILEYVQDNREARWQDMIVPIALILVMGFRVVQQDSVTAIERSAEPRTTTKGVLDD